MGPALTFLTTTPRGRPRRGGGKGRPLSVLSAAAGFGFYLRDTAAARHSLASDVPVTVGGRREGGKGHAPSTRWRASRAATVAGGGRSRSRTLMPRPSKDALRGGRGGPRALCDHAPFPEAPPTRCRKPPQKGQGRVSLTCSVPQFLPTPFRGLSLNKDVKPAVSQPPNAIGQRVPNDLSSDERARAPPPLL